MLEGQGTRGQYQRHRRGAHELLNGKNWRETHKFNGFLGYSSLELFLFYDNNMIGEPFVLFDPDHIDNMKDLSKT
jgi:hypothetical protein